MHELRIEGIVSRAPIQNNVKQPDALFSVDVQDKHFKQIGYREIAIGELVETVLKLVKIGQLVKVIGQPDFDVWRGEHGRLEHQFLIHADAIEEKGTAKPLPQPPQPLMKRLIRWKRQ